MGEVTDGFEPSPSLDADGDLPGFNELLSAQSFVERMEAARIRRAQVLAQQTQDADDTSGFLRTTKPWEKSNTPVRRAKRTVPQPKVWSKSVQPAAPLLLADSMRRTVKARPLILVKPEAHSPVVVPGKPKLSLSKVGGGFALGLMMGAGAIAAITWTGGDRGEFPLTQTAEPVGTDQLMAVATVPGVPGNAVEPGPFRKLPAFEPYLPNLLPDEGSKTSLPNPPAVETLPMTASPARLVASVALDAIPQAVAHNRSEQGYGVSDKLILTDSGTETGDVGLPRPGIITKIITLSAPAVLTPNATQWEPAISASLLPPSPPNTDFFRVSMNAPDQVSAGDLANIGPEISHGERFPIAMPQLFRVNFGADQVMSGGATETPAPFPAAVATLAESPWSRIDTSAYNITLHAQKNRAEEDALALVTSLTDAGFAIGEPVIVAFKISSNQVRFFHPEDAEAARILADEIGAKSRDFTTFKPAPPTGTMEIFLAGPQSVIATQRKKPQSSKPALSEDAQIRALRDRLILQLQTGQHL